MEVFTDGACSGNPGPGGWAWAVPGGRWAAGHESPSTNQRMELTAVLDALRTLDGPLEVVSDSTYVVNCFRDRWYEGWKKRGWTNSKKEPVANRDLWEPLVELYLARRPRPTFRWVKGHSGDAMNDLVDRLAVRAAQTQQPAAGDTPPSEDELGPPDAPGPGRAAPAVAPSAAGAPAAASSGDRRVPAGHLVVVLGEGDEAVPAERRPALRRRLAEILAAQAEMAPDLKVLSGLRQGAERLGAEAALEAGLPWVAVLPYPDPDRRWRAVDRADFRSLLDRADEVVALERSEPADLDGRRQALARRDAWLARAAQAAVLVRRSSDHSLDRLARSLGDHLGDDVWELDPSAI